MKYIFLLSFLLVSCTDEDQLVSMYQEAKDAGHGYQICYNISEPISIQGRYCTQYVGPRTK